MYRARSPYRYPDTVGLYDHVLWVLQSEERYESWDGPEHSIIIN